MRPGIKMLLGASLIAPSFLLVLSVPRAGFGDEPVSRLGRLFRFGGAQQANPKPAHAPSSFGTSPNSTARPSYPTAAPPSSSTPAAQPPAMLYSSPTEPAHGGNEPSNRIKPQPRVSKASTEADPILSRITLVRSNDGNQFGMSMQIFADGTVIDNEGVHHLTRADLKPLTDLLEAGDLYRQRGHCGSPATDFVEQVHMVVFERSLGRLRANAFSYSGNPQGCDHAVRHLHTVMEGIQAKLSKVASPSIAGTPTVISPVPSTNLESQGPIDSPGTPTGPTINLTPEN